MIQHILSNMIKINKKKFLTRKNVKKLSSATYFDHSYFVCGWCGLGSADKSFYSSNCQYRGKKIVMTSLLEQMYAVFAWNKESHKAISSEGLPKRRIGHTVHGELGDVLSKLWNDFVSGCSKIWLMWSCALFFTAMNLTSCWDIKCLQLDFVILELNMDLWSQERIRNADLCAL